MDIFDDKEDEEEEQAPITSRDEDKTARSTGGPSLAKARSSSKEQKEVYLSIENLQQITKPADGAAASAAKTTSKSAHSLLTEDKLKYETLQYFEYKIICKIWSYFLMIPIWQNVNQYNVKIQKGFNLSEW